MIPRQGLVDDLTKELEQLRLTMAEGFRAQNSMMNGGTTGTGRRCGMGGCKCPEEHAFGYNNCPHTHRLLEEELIWYDKRGRLVLMDGDKLPPPTRDVGGVAQKIRS